MTVTPVLVGLPCCYPPAPMPSPQLEDPGGRACGLCWHSAGSFVWRKEGTHGLRFWPVPLTGPPGVEPSPGPSVEQLMHLDYFLGP